MSLFRHNPEIHDNPEFRHSGHGYDPNQPRVPAGHSDGGQRTRDGDDEQPTGKGDGDGDGAPRTRLAFVQLPLIAGAAAAETTVGAAAIQWGLGLFSTLSLLNDHNRQAVIEFRAKEYSRDENGKLNIKAVTLLDRDEVQKFCPRLEEVQSRTDAAVTQISAARENLPPAEFGTAVHHLVKTQTNSQQDPNFRAEVSYLKTKDETENESLEEARYGQKGSVRIDVLENIPEEQRVCVYDIKTGASRFMPARMDEIAETVRKNFPSAQSFVVIEVRPTVGRIRRRR